MIEWYSQTKFHQWLVENVSKPSWPKLTSAVYGIPAGVAFAGAELAKLANDTQVSSYLAQIGVPNWVFGALATVALVQYIASSHD